MIADDDREDEVTVTIDRNVGWAPRAHHHCAQEDWFVCHLLVGTACPPYPACDKSMNSETNMQIMSRIFKKLYVPSVYKTRYAWDFAQ